MAPTVPAATIRFVGRDTVRLTTLPYAQPFAWVEPSRLFAGTLPRDDRVGHWRTVVRLRESVGVSLRALSWYAAPDSAARFLVTILYAERTAMVPIGQRPAGPNSTHDAPTGGTEIPFARVYRGVAIRRITDGATFWYIVQDVDRWTGERLIGNAVAELALGRRSSLPPRP